MQRFLRHQHSRSVLASELKLQLQRLLRMRPLCSPVPPLVVPLLRPLLRPPPLPLPPRR
jgi:hypothetical protein